MDYENFDIRIFRPQGSDSYQMMVQSSVLTALAGSHEVPFDEADAALRERIQFDEQGLLSTADDVENLGKELRGRLFPPEVWNYFNNCRQEVVARQTGLRIRLIIDAAAAALSQLPWEYCFDDLEQNNFIGLNDQTPIVRFMPTGRRLRDLETDRPKLLVAVASPTDVDWAQLYDLGIEERLAEIFDPIRDYVDCKLLFHTTLKKLTDELDKGYDIFQFLGHGVAPPGRAARIYLENPAGELDLVTHRELTQLLANKVKLCVLTACESAVHDPGDMFTGLAQALVKADIPAVVGMQLKIELEAATDFTQKFYYELSTGCTVDEALIKARRQAYADADRSNHWGIPVLYLQTDDARIWPDKTSDEKEQETAALVERSRTVSEEPEDARPKAVDDLLMALETLNFTKQLRALRLLRANNRARALVLSSGDVADVDGLHWLRNVLIRDVQRRTRKDVRRVNLMSRMTGGDGQALWNEVAKGCGETSRDPDVIAQAAVDQLDTEFWSPMVNKAGAVGVDAGVKETSLLLFILDTQTQLARSDHALLSHLPPLEPIEESVFMTWYSSSEHLFPEHMQDSETAEHILYGGQNGYHLQDPEGYLDDLLLNLETLCSGILAQIGN
jgi:hypothetical protein